MPSIIPAAIGAVGSIASGLIGADAAGDAADTQLQASREAQANTMAQYRETVARLSPWVTSGQGANQWLSMLTGTNPGGNPLTAPLTRPFTGADLANTPGYQFTRDQGLRAVQNSAAAKGLGVSGMALRGAADYATGLASTTYNDQLKNYLAQNLQLYNMLGGVSGSGQNAAAGLGSLGLNTTNAANSSLTSGAQSAASGIVGSANAFSGAINGVGNSASTYALLRGMYGSDSGSTGGAAAFNATQNQMPNDRGIYIPNNLDGG